MKNEKMDKMMKKVRVNMKLAKMKTVKFAKEMKEKADVAWDAANKAMDDYRKEMAERLKKDKDGDRPECKCEHCQCCDCHKEEVKEEKVEGVVEEIKEVEPEFENKDKE
jgi:hypothetical protein